MRARRYREPCRDTAGSALVSHQMPCDRCGMNGRSPFASCSRPQRPQQATYPDFRFCSSIVSRVRLKIRGQFTQRTISRSRGLGIRLALWPGICKTIASVCRTAAPRTSRAIITRTSGSGITRPVRYRPRPPRRPAPHRLPAVRRRAGERSGSVPGALR